MKYYIATRLENVMQHHELRDLLDARDHQITYDWTAHGSVWAKGTAVLRQTAVNELHGILEADVVIVLLPGGKGTHVEFGFALALAVSNNKEVMVVFNGGNDPLMNATPETCAFYHLPGITRVTSIDMAVMLIDEKWRRACDHNWVLCGRHCALYIHTCSKCQVTLTSRAERP